MRRMVSPADIVMSECVRLGIVLSPAAAGMMVALLDRMAIEPQNLTAVDLFVDGVRRHLVDSLAGLMLESVRTADSIVDLGSGGGFPGLPIAMACPECAVTLVDSERSKAEWLSRQAADLPNVRVVADRSEHLGMREREAWQIATARALAPLPVLMELAAPLVGVGGTVVAWRGPRDHDEEARAAKACEVLGLEPGPVTSVAVCEGTQRHLHEYRKVRPTPDRFPRRAGRAATRPLA